MAVAALCRRFSGVLRLAGAASSRLTRHVLQKEAAKAELFPPCASLHVSFPLKGLEEFFDDPKNWGETEIKSGDSWTVEQLRGKSSEDLHKLWYVLLKERNMLLTLEQEAKRQRLPMPSPERLEKVETSMERMDQVIQEREDALRLLQTGQEKQWPGEWRHDFLGRIIWYTFREWPIPWHLNSKHNRKRFYFLKNVEPFNRLRLEKYLRDQYKAKRREQTNRRKLLKRYPHLAAKSES
ncbi:PREDICTED: 39S ribosomal protein L47, mitochondrial [Gekko japonicus]|uniref:Large ribosomal subunit protein uL29m n=1 Tax=Gekko japonicus TaxID=146911 RepID=Q5EHX4_GEKJA|nr:large ribosomal subunit protein uL29m [Gekko japonicus]XP_015278837.1 PREDICTED: 39S ribosomal protein L47, mitochondrial [Gekko japonicus]AAW79023.1 GekBS177P [Gekko japonicus]